MSLHARERDVLEGIPELGHAEEGAAERQDQQSVMSALEWQRDATFHRFFTRSMLELDAFGLSSHWRDEFARVPTECVRPAEPLRLRQLSLSHLSGPFALLGLGLGLAVAVFLAETILHRSKALKIASL